MNFKVGDKVRVRSWDSMEKEFGLDEDGDIPVGEAFTTKMKEYCDKVVTIKRAIDNINYKIEEDNQLFKWIDEMLEPVEFDWESFKDKSNKIVVHCKTEEEAKDFCKQMHEQGMKWGDDCNYLDLTRWGNYKSKTCYTGCGTHADYDWYKKQNYTILEYEDYFMETKKEFTLDDLKDEMIVERQNGDFYLVLGEKFIGKNGFLRKVHYNSNFTFSYGGSDGKWDIVAVYPPSKTYVHGLMDMLQPDEAPIWKRKKRIPEACKNILIQINKKYNWIAKDSDGTVCIYKDKPVKKEEDWEDREYDFETLTGIFNGSLFDWLSWEDEEPVNFREVLKGE